MCMRPAWAASCYNDALLAGGHAYITYDTVESVERALNACRSRNGRKKFYVKTHDGFKTVVRNYGNCAFL